MKPGVYIELTASQLIEIIEAATGEPMKNIVILQTAITGKNEAPACKCYINRSKNIEEIKQ